MTGPEHFRQAEEIAEHVEGLIQGGDLHDYAPIWAALGQVHATLALAAATALGTSGTEAQAWTDAAGTKPGGRGS